jgi:hypothetical protein
LKASSVCKSWRNIILENNEIWRQHFVRRWIYAKPQIKVTSWYRFYKARRVEEIKLKKTGIQIFFLDYVEEI